MPAHPGKNLIVHPVGKIFNLLIWENIIPQKIKWPAPEENYLLYCWHLVCGSGPLFLWEEVELHSSRYTVNLDCLGSFLSILVDSSLIVLISKIVLNYRDTANFDYLVSFLSILVDSSLIVLIYKIALDYRDTANFDYLVFSSQSWQTQVSLS